MRKELSKEAIGKIIARSSSAQDAIRLLWEVALPDLNHVKRISTFPKASPETTAYIFKLGIQAFNGVFTSEWMNRGFKTDPDLPDWVVSIDWSHVVYDEEFLKHQASLSQSGIAPASGNGIIAEKIEVLDQCSHAISAGIAILIKQIDESADDSCIDKDLFQHLNHVLSRIPMNGGYGKHMQLQSKVEKML